MGRGQLSVSLVEATVGVLFLFAVASGFLLGAPDADVERSQLDTYARDAATILSYEQSGDVTLADVAASPGAVDRHRGALADRLSGLLPPHVLYRVETAHGVVGYPLPAHAPAGTARVTTVYGGVTVRVWYA